MEIMKQVFERLRAANLHCQPRKAEFCKTSVNYLGFLLTPEGHLPDPVRAKALLKAERPTNVRRIREYLGFVGYYRRHPSFQPKSNVSYGATEKGCTIYLGRKLRGQFQLFQTQPDKCSYFKVT